MILTTTSRNPSVETRKLARRLSELVPYSLYTPRGVRGIEKLADVARKKGYRRICIVNEQKKKPAEMQFIVVDACSWDWHPTILKIKDVAINKEHEKDRLFELKLQGTGKKETSELFDADEFDDEDAEGVLKITKEAIGFYSDSVELLKITLE